VFLHCFEGSSNHGNAAGADLVKVIESTPLDDASDFEIDSDFMPVLKEVIVYNLYIVLFFMP
jgi:hypothetical protein